MIERTHPQHSSRTDGYGDPERPRSFHWERRLRVERLTMEAGLTEKGNKAALLFVLFHKRVCGPLANSLFNQPPNPELPPPTKIEAAYRRAGQSIQHGIELLAA